MPRNGKSRYMVDPADMSAEDDPDASFYTAHETSVDLKEACEITFIISAALGLIADEQEETPGESSSQTTYLIQLQVEHLESQLSRVNQSEIALRRENSTLLGVNKKLQIEVEAHRRRQANQSSLINKLRNKMRDDISILELEKAEMGKLKGALEEERGDARPVSDGAVVRVAPRPDGLTIKKKAIKSTEGAENTLAAQRREAKRNELGVGVPLRPTKENGNSSTWLDTSSSKLDTPSSLAQFRRTLSRPDQLKGITPPGRSALSKPKRKKARKSDGISRSPFLKPSERLGKKTFGTPLKQNDRLQIR